MLHPEKAPAGSRLLPGQHRDPLPEKAPGTGGESRPAQPSPAEKKRRTAAPPRGAGAEPHPIPGRFDVPHCGASDGGVPGRSADTVCGWGGEKGVSKKIPAIKSDVSSICML